MFPFRWGTPQHRAEPPLRFPLEQGKPLPTGWGSFSTPCQGCAYPSDWTPPGQGCVHLVSGSHHAPPQQTGHPPKQGCARPSDLLPASLEMNPANALSFSFGLNVPETRWVTPQVGMPIQGHVPSYPLECLLPKAWPSFLSTFAPRTRPGGLL